MPLVQEDDRQHTYINRDGSQEGTVLSLSSGKSQRQDVSICASEHGAKLSDRKVGHLDANDYAKSYISKTIQKRVCEMISTKQLRRVRKIGACAKKLACAKKKKRLNHTKQVGSPASYNAPEMGIFLPDRIADFRRTWAESFRS